MRYWLSRQSEVPIREQLHRQIVLAILSGDLPAGARLPSTRSLARRFQVHANTVSAVYKDLHRDGWIDGKRGSGVFVRARAKHETVSANVALDQAIAELFHAARQQGIPLNTLQQRLRHWLSLEPPRLLMFIHPDVELRRIVEHELGSSLNLRVESASPEDAKVPARMNAAIAITMPSKAETVREAIGPTAELIVLQVQSINASLMKYLPVKEAPLLGVASRWPEFLASAKTMLLAAGLDGDGLVFRDARDRMWTKGLSECAAIVCDSLTAEALPRGCRALPFRVVSEASLEQLRAYERFIGLQD
jgi:DNA-binding transcriptional regulator YhcF (GntR family)